MLERKKKMFPSIAKDIKGVWFFSFLLKAICFQTLGCLFFYFFMSYYKILTKYKKSKYVIFSK